MFYVKKDDQHYSSAGLVGTFGFHLTSTTLSQAQATSLDCAMSSFITERVTYWTKSNQEKSLIIFQ